MNIFEEVKQRLNITQVIEHYGFKVNRARQFVCPFHNDHKPSASIKNDYFHCFVCGAGGDLITFTAKYLGMNNLDAAKELVKEFNLNIDIRTPKEKKSQYITQKQNREEINKCVSLRDKFKKDKEQRAEAEIYRNYKLRNEVRQANKKKEIEKEGYIQYVGFVLADMHRFLWQGIHLYPYEHERHIQGLQELTLCQYWIECYENNPLKFCIECKGVVDRYERKLNILNK